MLWPTLIATHSSHTAEIRGRTLVLSSQTPRTVSSAPEQRLQLATPSYKLKKEKREAKKLEGSSTPSKDNDTFVD